MEENISEKIVEIYTNTGKLKKLCKMAMQEDSNAETQYVLYIMMDYIENILKLCNGK